MNDLILNLVRFNEEVDFTIVIPLTILYFFIFWVIVSIWVYIDSKPRLKSKKRAIAVALLNQIFGLPFLLLYILARPFDESELLHVKEEDNDRKMNGGVNVPLVNFTGKDGVVMSLEIKINPENINEKKDTEMKIDVSFDSKDENKQISEIKAELSSKIKELNKEVTNTAINTGNINSIIKKIKGLFKKDKADNKIQGPKIEEEKKIVENNEIKKVENIFKKKKKKKKK